MKTIATFSNLAEASFAQSVLQGEGLSATLQNVESSVNFSGGPPAFQIVVSDDDQERAAEVVRPFLVSHTTPAQVAAFKPQQRSFLRFLKRGTLIGLGLGLAYVFIGLVCAQSEYFSNPGVLLGIPILAGGFGAILAYTSWSLYDSGFQAGLRSKDKPKPAPAPAPSPAAPGPRQP